MEEEALGNDLEQGLDQEDDEEGILNVLLHEGERVTEKGGVRRMRRLLLYAWYIIIVLYCIVLYLFVLYYNVL